MLPSRIELPLPVRLLNAAGRLLRAAGFSFVHFDEEALCRAAMRMTGLHDFGDAYFRSGLRALVEAANSTILHPAGHVLFFRFVVYNLMNRLLFVEARKRAPERFESRLLPPLIVLGLPRTGTTYIHRLLALDPARRGVPLWQMLPIYIPGGPSERQRQRRRLECALRARQWLMPGLDGKHYVRADSPEECLWMLGLTFESSLFWVMAPIYGYMEWYMEQERRQKYAEYGLMLRLLQSEDPERALTLKAPEHTDSLQEILEAVPEARIVQTHRDPVEACSSLNSLLYTTHAAVAAEVDVSRMAETNARSLEITIVRNLAARAAHPGCVCDVWYDALTSDPVGVVRRIYTHFGMAFSTAFEARLREYVLTHPKGRHGAHNYHASEFGQSEAELARRFASYRDQFGFSV